MIENTENNEITAAETHTTPEEFFTPETHRHAEHVSRLVEYFLTAAQSDEDEEKHAGIGTPHGALWHATMTTASSLSPDPAEIMAVLFTNPFAFLNAYVSRAMRVGFHAGHAYATRGYAIENEKYPDFDAVTEESVMEDVNETLLKNARSVMTGQPVEQDTCDCKNCERVNKIVATLGENGIDARRRRLPNGMNTVTIADEDKERAAKILDDMGETVQIMGAGEYAARSAMHDMGMTRSDDAPSESPETGPTGLYL